MDVVDRRWISGLTDEIVTRGTGGPLCPCHGSLAWLELLHLARRRRLIADRSGKIESWRRSLLAAIVDGRWFADTIDALESPSLMLGLAGTGHMLLRVAVGASVPSFLLLDDLKP